MRRPDPRIMLLIAACFSTLGVLIETTWLLAAVFAFVVLFSAVLGAHMMLLVRRLRGLLAFIVVIAVLQSVFNPTGQTLVHIGSVNLVTTGGLLRAAGTLLRIGTVIASASIFTLTTSRRMIQGMVQLKVPYELAFMASVALRFMPVFAEEFRDAVVAIQLRGVDLKKTPLREKLGLYTAILMPTIYGAVDKAQKLSYAMELRAFRAYPKRTSRFVLCMGTADYAYMVIIPLITAAVLTIYYIYL